MKKFQWMRCVLLAIIVLVLLLGPGAFAATPEELAAHPVTLELKDVPLQEAINAIGPAGCAVFVSSHAHERVSASLPDLPRLAALFAVVRKCGYKWDLRRESASDPGAVLVLSERMASVQQLMRSQQRDKHPTIVRLKHIKEATAAESIMRTFPEIPATDIQVMTGYNAVVVGYVPHMVAEDVRTFALLLDETAPEWYRNRYWK